MNDGSWHFIDNLTANAAAYLGDHPILSKAAIALTLAAGCFAIVSARAWSVSVCSDRKLRRAGRDAASLAQHAARAHEQIVGADDAARPAPPNESCRHTADCGRGSDG